MNKVYIVTTGEYSDYHIVNVFASREKAEKYIKIRTKEDKEEFYGCVYNAYNIEEYTVVDDYLNINYWCVRVEANFSKDLKEEGYCTTIYSQNGADVNKRKFLSSFISCKQIADYNFIFSTYVPTTQFDTEEKLEEHYVKVVRDYVPKLKYMVQVDGLSVNEAAVLIDEQIKKEGIV